MKLSPIVKSKLSMVLLITSAWTVISMLQLGYEMAVLLEYGYEYRWSDEDGFMHYFLINSIAFVVNGFIGGVLVVFFLQNWIRDRSYSQGILFGVILYVILFFVMTCIQTYFVVSSIWDGTHSFSSAYIKGLKDYFLSYEFIRYFPFWLMILTGTLIVLLINDRYGPGVLNKFLRGSYFHPKAEERIFMFLDLKGSTTIAEKLGEEKYFKFIRKVLKDVTPVILKTKGEVYQYVGDEIVISWSIEEGMKNLNCLACFTEIQKLLKTLGPEYQERFGLQPVFKAGMHAGSVVVGEIGVIKRDIAYSGDVLNTAARIQSKCNDMGVLILFSDALLKYMPKNDLSIKPMGQVVLRGKSESVSLYSLASA